MLSMSVEAVPWVDPSALPLVVVLLFHISLFTNGTLLITLPHTVDTVEPAVRSIPFDGSFCSGRCASMSPDTHTAGVPAADGFEVLLEDTAAEDNLEAGSNPYPEAGCTELGTALEAAD